MFLTKKHLPRIFFGFAVSALCLWWVLRGFGWDELHPTLRSIDLRWFLVLFPLYVTAYIFRTARWRYFFPTEKPPRMKDLFPILGVGYLVNNLLPARAGELARSYFASKDYGINLMSAIGSVAADRFSDFIGIGVLILLAIPVFGFNRLPVGKAVVILIFGILFFLSFLFISKKIQFQRKKPHSIWLKKIESLIVKFSDGFKKIQSSDSVKGVVVFSILTWLTELATVFLYSRSFQFNLTPFQSAALVVGLSFGVMIPAAPGYIGTYELFGQKSLVMMGFPSSPALSFILVYHFFQLITSSSIGLLYFFKWKSNLSRE